MLYIWTSFHFKYKKIQSANRLKGVGPFFSRTKSLFCFRLSPVFPHHLLFLLIQSFHVILHAIVVQSKLLFSFWQGKSCTESQHRDTYSWGWIAFIVSVFITVGELKLVNLAFWKGLKLFYTDGNSYTWKYCEEEIRPTFSQISSYAANLQLEPEGKPPSKRRAFNTNEWYINLDLCWVVCVKTQLCFILNFRSF